MDVFLHLHIIFNQNQINMKKSYLFLTVICFVMTVTMSSCTKERIMLDLLYGTWHLDSQLDDDGVLVVYPAGMTVEEISTFFRCSDKENEPCTGTTKTTTTVVAGGTTTTGINSSSFSYRVFQKSQLLIGGTVYEISEIKKKSLVIHEVEEPLATKTYSKI